MNALSTSKMYFLKRLLVLHDSTNSFNTSAKLRIQAVKNLCLTNRCPEGNSLWIQHHLKKTPHSNIIVFIHCNNVTVPLQTMCPIITTGVKVCHATGVICRTEHAINCYTAQNSKGVMRIWKLFKLLTGRCICSVKTEEKKMNESVKNFVAMS